MSSSSENAEAVLATVVAARRRIEHLVTRHLPVQRALAFEIARTVGGSREREQIMMLSGILDRRLNLMRSSITQPISPAPVIQKIPQTRPPVEDFTEQTAPRGLRTLTLNGGDPDDVTLTDSDRVRMILDAEDLDAEDFVDSFTSAPEEDAPLVIDDEDDVQPEDDGLEEETAATTTAALARQETLREEAIDDDIAWVVDGRRPPGFEEADERSPTPAVDSDAFLSEPGGRPLSPEEELDRLVLEELERARAEADLVRDDDLVAEDNTDEDADEDANIQHILAAEDDFSHLVVDENDLKEEAPALEDDGASLVFEDEPEEPAAADESSNGPPFSRIEEDFSHLVVDENDSDFEDDLEGEDNFEDEDAASDFEDGPPLIYTEDGPPLVFEDEPEEPADPIDPDSLVIDDSDPINLDHLVIDDEAIEDDLAIDEDEEPVLLEEPALPEEPVLPEDPGEVSAPVLEPLPELEDEGLEESTVLMDSAELARTLAAESAAFPRSVAAQIAPVVEEEELEQPRGAAIQLLGTGQARTLGHTLELEAADNDDSDFADEWDSDEDSDEVSSTGGLSISFEEEYEDAPLIPQLTESPSVGPSTAESATYDDTIHEDDIAHALTLARDVEARGDLQNAIILYGDVIDLDPTCGEARMGRGRCMMELGDYAAAISDFQRAEDLNPTSAEPAQGMGDLFYSRKDYGRAIDFYTQAINLDASQILARVRRGMCFYYKKDNQKALADLERAYAMDPSIPGLSSSISQVSRAMRRR